MSSFFTVMACTSHTVRLIIEAPQRRSVPARNSATSQVTVELGHDLAVF